MLRQITPRNARSKRALEKRAPKNEENPKTCLFLRGTSASQVVQDCLTDLHAMRAPLAKKFTKKNAVHPFEDPSSLEFFSRKNDTSLLVFGSSSKKRRHCLTLCRTFDHAVLDMLELYVDETTYRRPGRVGEEGEEEATEEAAAVDAGTNSTETEATETTDAPDSTKTKHRSIPVGARPMVLFAGAPFYEGGQEPGAVAVTEAGRKYALAKSLLTDFFRGDSSPDKIDVEGLSHIVVVTAAENGAAATASTPAAPADPASSPLLYLRVYALQTKRSGQRMPRIEVEEIGPRMDLRLGRFQEPDANMLKEAMRRAKTAEARTKKNIEVDGMGDKIGRIHLGKQDLGELQTRKMKGLKRQRGEAEDPDEGGVRLAPADGLKKAKR